MEKLGRTLSIIGLLLIVSSYSVLKSQDIFSDCINKDLSCLIQDFKPTQLQNYSKYEYIMRYARVKEWVENIDKGNIKTYLLSNGKREYLILSSTVLAATGLASNFYNWLLINIKNNVIVKTDLMSLSDNPNSFYFRKNHFYFIEYKFGERFILNKNYNNPDIERVRHIVENDKLNKKNFGRIKCE
jgi:hypothetical protein